MASRASSTGGVDAQPQPSHHETAHSAAAVQSRVRETLTSNRHARNNTPREADHSPETHTQDAADYALRTIISISFHKPLRRSGPRLLGPPPRSLAPSNRLTRRMHWPDPHPPLSHHDELTELVGVVVDDVEETRKFGI